jgi:hypothetical protein
MTGDGGYMQLLKQTMGRFVGEFGHTYPTLNHNRLIDGAHIARGQIRSQAVEVSIMIVCW